MNNYKYTSKKEQWVSNGNGDKILKRTYSYNHDESAFAVALVCVLISLPFLIIHKLKNRNRYKHNKSIIERLKASQQRSLEKIQKRQQKLWDIIKIKRKKESDIHWKRRLQRYGFTTDGIHIKTGVNYQYNTRKEIAKMNIDIKSKLKELEGETFYTVTGKPYTYEFLSENVIKSSRARYHISLSSFEKAIEINPTRVCQIQKEVRGPSYVFGIITDSRFK